MNTLKSLTLCIAFVGVATLLTSCKDKEEGDRLDDIITEIRLDDFSGEFVNETFPEDASNPQCPTVNGSSEIVRGGSIVLQVDVADGADQLVVGSGGEEGGYFRFNLQEASARVFQQGASSGTGQALLQRKYPKAGETMRLDASQQQIETYIVFITLAQDDEMTGFTFRLGYLIDGAPSCAESHPVEINETAATSGELQVSLNWSNAVDMDLHVETPDEEDIYYGERVGMAGGSLDLDSNASCFIDGVNNENITWAGETPACGEYIVRVDLWSACALPGPFPYVVTVNNKGTIETFTGSFLASEETEGGAFDGRVITTIDVCGAGKVEL
ncbi:MAG: hypothetical protein SH809_01045 [Rhodothermales bacterium]|nr:hypothetical protein [Rhodothermales bacterium]